MDSTQAPPPPPPPAHPARTGPLLKEGEAGQPWQTFHFVLDADEVGVATLAWYEGAGGGAYTGRVPLAGASVSNTEEVRSGKYAFQLTLPQGQPSTLVLSGTLPAETSDWVKALEDFGVQSSFSIDKAVGATAVNADAESLKPPAATSSVVDGQTSGAAADGGSFAPPGRVRALSSQFELISTGSEANLARSPRTSITKAPGTAASIGGKALRTGTAEERQPLNTSAPSDGIEPPNFTCKTCLASHALGLGLVLLLVLTFTGLYANYRGADQPHPFAVWLFDCHGECNDGLIMPAPCKSSFNAGLWLFLLLWSFLGVAIAADAFMNGIEEITSQEMQKELVINGKPKKFTVTVWNATVANLTLMALGSSAPEILLSIIEIGSSGFYSGELGPSTIVGSAAFNLFVISAVCVASIPGGETKKIKDISVFVITSAFSVFAYLWLVFILLFSSPNVVEVWEGVITLIFFPVLVILAWAADSGYFSPKTGAPKTVVGYTLDGKTITLQELSKVVANTMDQSLLALHPSELAKHAKGLFTPKSSRAAYRNKAIRSALGGDNIDVSPPTPLVSVQAAPAASVKLEFVEEAVGFTESTPFATLTVRRVAQPGVAQAEALTWAGTVGYTAKPAGDFVARQEYLSTAGELSFGAGQAHAELRIPLINDDLPNADEVFAVVLQSPSSGAVLGTPSTCVVTVHDDDGEGVLLFLHEALTVKESEKKVELQVIRRGRLDGTVGCSFTTKDGSAVAPADYTAASGKLTFGPGESQKAIEIEIIDDGKFELDEKFQVVLTEPFGGATFDPQTDGFKERSIATVTIISDDERQGIIDDISALMNINIDHIDIAKSSYAEQFADAVAVDWTVPTPLLLLQILSVPWKLIFALVPPPKTCGGYPCFVVALVGIGVLTALVGDLADQFGCTVGMASSVTAITLVALGTSLPDTFASRTAAVNEAYADSSIGNITGSNSVNVFLGLGLPWAAAAVYWALNGQAHEAEWRARYQAEPWYSASMPVGFAVPSGDLGFSVAVFSVLAFACLSLIALRRCVSGYELGGPPLSKYGISIIFVMFWVVYVVISVAKTYALI